MANTQKKGQQMLKLLTGALCILGVLYLSELNQTNPPVGLPISALIITLWLGTAFVDWAAKRR